jgi:hypothetical protein
MIGCPIPQSLWIKQSTHQQGVTGTFDILGQQFRIQKISYSAKMGEATT